MTALGDAILTRLRLVVAAQNVIDLSRPRTGLGTNTEDTDLVEEAAEDAAGVVERYAGTVTATHSDLSYLKSEGVQIALVHLQAIWPLMFGDAPVDHLTNIHARLERYADSRLAESSGDPVATDYDYTELDTRYPGTTWED